MKQSLRRISEVLLAAGALALFAGMLMSFSLQCAAGSSSCLAAGVSFGIPERDVSAMMQSQTMTGQALETAAVGTGYGTFSFISDVAKQVGASLIFIAVATVLILELLELHYLRKIVSLRKQRS